MAAPKNHYATLGVTETATADEIKKAYRKLAKKYHPDVTGGDKAKESKFKEFAEAYDTLSDEKKRKDYDAQRRNPFAGRGNPFAGGGGRQQDVDMSGIDLDELFAQFGGQRGGRARQPQGGQGFGDIFGNMFAGGGAARTQEQARGKGEDAHARLDIDLPEAALGAEKTISIDGHRSLKVKIPAGITSGKTIRLAGQGQPGRGQAGDLLVEVHERPHARFRRREGTAQDIDVEVPVQLEVALAGGKADVPTLEGTTVSLTVPAMTSSGKRLRLRGKGAVHGGGRGDLYAEILISLPESLTLEQKSALDAFVKTLKK